MALDLYDLFFSICIPGDRQPVLAGYLAEFAEFTDKRLDPHIIWRQLGGAFLRKFAFTTCGVANWQPASPRDETIIETGIERALVALEFWLERDPDLFLFMDGS